MAGSTLFFLTSRISYSLLHLSSLVLSSHFIRSIWSLAVIKGAVLYLLRVFIPASMAPGSGCAGKW
jgi:hypothetical protein